MGKLVIAEHARNAVARAFAPQRDHDLLAFGLQCAHMRDDGLEDVDGGIVALGREIAALTGAGIDDGSVGRHRKRGQPRQRRIGQALGPLLFAEIEPVGRQRLVGRVGAISIERLAPRLVVVDDLGEPLVPARVKLIGALLAPSARS